MNKKVVILTDSACDLPQSYLDENNVDFISYHINLKEKTFLDRVDLTTKEMFKKIDQAKEITKTAAISPAEYAAFFKKYTDENDVVYIGLASGFSSSNNSAKLAAGEFDNVYVVDSQNLSAGIGLLVNKAVKFRNEGFSAKEIFDKVNELVPLVRVQFVIDTLKYLHMGGRCSGVSKFFGTALKLKPIIRVLDNKMVVAKKPIGYSRGLQALLGYLEQDKDNIDEDMMTITHCLADKDAEYLKNEIPNIVSHNNLMETHAGCVISTHCGPRCIGILYILKHPENN
jgi:DegV family protein with EDD domain